LKACDKASGLKSDYYQAWFLKGAVLDYLGRPMEALNVYEKVIKIKLDERDAIYNIARIYSRLSNRSEALNNLSKAIELNSQYHVQVYVIMLFRQSEVILIKELRK
jgi:tetratricopeptide (TPR) repeat protein